MIVTNGTMQVIEGKVELPLTIEEVTRLCEVRFSEHFDTEMILGLDAQAEFDMYFGSRFKKVCMPESGRHNPLKTWLVEEEGCGAIVDYLLGEEQSLPRLPKTERCFEEGCLSDNVYVGHPEKVKSLEVYLDN